MPDRKREIAAAFLIGGGILALFLLKRRLNIPILIPTLEGQRILQALGPFNSIIETEARFAGIEPNLVRAIIWEESRGNPNASGRAGEIGLMQILPSTARSLGCPLETLWNPVNNIRCGVTLLRRLFDEFGNVQDVICAYNSGDPCHSAPTITRIDYLPSVLQNLSNLGVMM